MEIFCGGNSTTGGSVRSDCRTDLFIVVVNCAFVLDCICVFLWKIARSSKSSKSDTNSDIVFRFREHNTRWVLSLCFVLVTWCDIGDAIFASQLSNQYRLSTLLPPCGSLLAVLMSLIYYNKLESWKLYKPLLLLLVFWAASFLLRAIKLVQLYNMGFGLRHLCVDVSWAYLVVCLMLMIVEISLLLSQRYILSREVRSTEAQYNVSGLKYVYSSSNVISKCVFWWMTPVLRAGYKHPLELQDLGLLPQPDHVERQFERFNEIYLQEKEKAEVTRKPVSVWRCFWRFCWPIMTLSGVFKLLSDLVGYIAPLSIGIIIKFVNAKLNVQEEADKVVFGNEVDDALTIWEFLQNGYVMAGIVLLATIAQSTFAHMAIQLVIMESIHLRSCIQTLVYNKCLRMSTWQATGNVDVGTIINLVSSDSFNLMMLFMMGHFIWAIPLQIAVLLVLLTLQVGYSALIGAASVALFIPLQFLISKYMSKLQKKILAASDWRLKKTSELLDGMKLLKLHAWEKLFGEEIHAIREKELKLLLKDAMCWSSNSFLTQVSSIVLALVTFAVYSTVEGKSLTPEEVFTCLALFGQLAVPLFLFPIVVPIVISAVVSARRLKSFLSLSDVNHSTIKHVDTEGSTILEFEADSGSIVLHIKEHKPDKKQNSFRDSEVFLCDSDDDLEGDRNVAVELKNASFTWDAVNKEPMLHNVTTQFPAGNLTIIVGSVGSGKTSLLSALLGEMCMLEGIVKWSRNSPIGYVPQKPWLINASLRDNILFGQAYDARRFSRVIAACALQVDIDLLPGGDQTEIGEKGVNLSGGQKQRIAIARALYSRCKTLLLDDPFSALDAQVGLHVFEEGVKKLLLRYKRTVILVTHRLQFLSQASKIMFMENGFIKYQGSFNEIESCNSELCNRWKATMNREEKECKQENAGDGTSQERRKLVRLISQRSTSVVEDVQPRGRAFMMQRQISCDTSHPFPVHDFSEHLSESSLHHSTLSVKSQKIGYEENCENGSRQLKRMISMKSTISHEVPEETEEQPDDDKELDETAVQLISKEQRERGSVSSKVFLSYARACGWPFCLLVLFAAISTQATNLGKDFWLSDWSSASKKEKDAAVPGDEFTDEVLKYYLPVYAALSLIAIMLSLCTNIAGAFAGVRAQRQLHYSMLDRIVQAPMRFFDTNPAGRILNRFSGDIGVLDKKVAMTIQLFLRFVLLCLSAIIVNIVVSVYFLAIVLPIFIIYYVVQKFFRSSSRELQRIDSITKSPIYSHFSETVNGLTTIRAFRDEVRFKEKFASTINTNNLVFLFITAANRWLGIALDYLGGIIVFAATIAAVTAALYGAIPAGFVGLAMAYSLLIPIYLNWVVRHAADTEMYMSGVERIGQYINISTEEYNGNKEPPEEWPFSGEIRMENASLRYDVGLQPVLSKVSMNIKPGEKVGICGRTGSGKSSLTLGLFRMIDIFEGCIYIDDVDITKVPLTVLRSRLAIIPQESVMFTGSLRLNLDPEEGHSENELWDALEKAQLKDVLENMSQGLDTEVSQGDSFSIGQRQLFCLARAILRKSKIVVMDEATASLDSDTDRIVQKVMAEAFADCTVLTIAHRISTILHYDKIVVLDAGNIVEFGPPSELLKKPGSIFLSLVKANK